MLKKGNPYGMHRVIHPKGGLPQPAEKLDASTPIYSNEILIEVERINVDSTSFRQLSESVSHDRKKLEANILALVNQRGKLHNPVTNSGGMLIGQVKEIGQNYQGALSLNRGDRIATLVSLTLTPLHLEKINSIDLKTGQLSVKGHAILFESGIACPLPKDIPEAIALAILDICGAPALTLRHVKKNDTVLFIGAGKSAKLSAAALRNAWGEGVKITSVDVDQESLEEMKKLKLADEVYCENATSPLFTKEEDKLVNYDVVINVTNIPNTELSSILAVREGGIILFFGMGTSFTKVALGAEGVGKDANFLIGSGYVKGHATLALDIVRKNIPLKKWFEKKYLSFS